MNPAAFVFGVLLAVVVGSVFVQMAKQTFGDAQRLWAAEAVADAGFKAFLGLLLVLATVALEVAILWLATQPQSFWLSH